MYYNALCVIQISLMISAHVDGQKPEFKSFAEIGGLKKSAVGWQLQNRVVSASSVQPFCSYRVDGWGWIDTLADITLRHKG